jgi:hypothetical protein
MPAQPVGGGGVYGGAARLQVPALAQSLAPQMASNIGPMGSACARRSAAQASVCPAWVLGWFIGSGGKLPSFV